MLLFFFLCAEKDATLHETILRSVVRKLFPKVKMYFNARKSAGLKLNGEVTYYLELDVWIPELKLGFEYQVFGV